MKLYCPQCNKVTSRKDSIQGSDTNIKGLICNTCGHFQPTNSVKDKNNMATKKNPITGSTTKRSSAKGSLTGSKRFETPDVTSNNLIQSVASNVSSRANTLTESVKSLGNSRNTSSNVSTLRSSSGQSHTEALSKANTIASQYGIEQIDIGSLLGSDPYSADSNIPEMTAAEANKNKLKLQRQSNAIEVRHEKIKLGRKAVKMATEQVGLVGDLVDYATAGIDTATKVVKNEIASVKFQTEQSKLVQTEEFFTQQQIATDGTIALTDGIREEWQLKLEKQATRNSGLRIEVEGSIQENERKREELEAKLLAA